MKGGRRFRLAVATAVFAITTWYYGPREPTLLSFRVGQRFEDVVKGSTFPVIEHSSLPARDPMGLQAGETYVTEPAVILHFNDPKHGFILPPTKFAVVGYMHNRVDTVATSPSLKKLSFKEAVAVLENLQNQFKAGGWKPYEGDASEWFDLTPDGIKQLYAQMLEPGYRQRTVSLHVPKKYGMTFRLWCAKGCGTGKPPYLFMIDIGVSSDTYSWEPGDPKEVWDDSPPAPAAPSAKAKLSARGSVE